MKGLTNEQLRADAARLLEILEARRELEIGFRRDVSGITLHCTVLGALIERLPKQRRPKPTTPPAQCQAAFDWCRPACEGVD